MSKVLTILVLAFFSNFRSIDPSFLVNNFNSQELRDIEIIIEEFDNMINPSGDSTKLMSSYSLFFEELSGAKTIEEFDSVISKKIKTENILSKISMDTFNTIWKRYSNTSLEDEGFILALKKNNVKFDQQRVDINLKNDHQSNYYRFLREITTQNDILKEYFEKVETVGSIGGSNLLFINLRYKKLDLSDKIVRFIIAVHYLTLAQNCVKKGISPE